MQFDSFEALAAHFSRAADAIGPATLRELSAQGAAIAAEYKRHFGTYGPGWAVLSEATQRERARLGFMPDDPLLRSGHLQGLIDHRLEGETLFVGVWDGMTLEDGTEAPMVLAALENGTSDGRIPPRPVGLQVLAQMDRFASAFARGLAVRISL